MRLMSFAHTSEQVLAQTKTVTRRTGWRSLEVGTRLLACEKVRGVRVEDRRALGVIIVVDVRREPLQRMADDPVYGREEITREGFAEHPSLGSPDEWVQWFCKNHQPCTPQTIITRIEFIYD